MDLTERQRRILAAVVEHHIATGEPIGSKELVAHLKDAPSSATLRNEMNSLCAIGYLSQPHTSAGRVPTSLGYRFYVTELMKHGRLPEDTKQMIDDRLERAEHDAESLSQAAGELLSDVTGLPSLSAYVAHESAVVKRVRLTPLGGRMYMMVLMVSDGQIRSRICRAPGVMDTAQIQLFEDIVRKQVEGKLLTELTPATVQNLMVAAGMEALTLAPFFQYLLSMLHQICEDRLCVNGESNLFSMLSEPQKAERLLSFIQRKDGMLSVISHMDGPVGVVFGNQTAFSELSPSAVIVARYGVGSNGIGRIGVIGPTRMSYDRIIPSVEYLAERLTGLMSKSLHDLEG